MSEAAAARNESPSELHAELYRLGAVASSSRRGAEAARLELAEAIRKAHREGASIRAIAVATGLSSSRVGVIVKGGQP